MTDPTTSILGSSTRYRIFTAVKYLVYVLLSINVLLFLQEELLALPHTFADGIKPGQIIQSFAATIDTGAWVVLLLLFELETSVLEDKVIKDGTRLALHGIRGLCYLAIVYAFTGYYAELATLYDVVALQGIDPCSMIGQKFSLLIDIDEYLMLDSDSCAAMGPELFRLNQFDVVSDGATLTAVQNLGWVDIINSGTWILVCALLEIEVRLQLRGELSDQIMGWTKYIKYFLYGTLFAAAGFWGYAGDFLDFWDASLWLFAFIFIELNVFEWQHETTHDGVPA